MAQYLKKVIKQWIIEYSMRKIFLEKSYTKRGGETIPRFFSKKVKIEHWAYLWITSVKYYSIHFVFIVCKVEGYRTISKLSCRLLAFTSHKAFFLKKNDVWN